MYLENNYEKEPGYTNVLNAKENKEAILEELKFNITTQFKFENLGYNYLADYENPPLEIYDWLLDHINEYYFVIDNLISIYEQVDRLRFVASTLYNFLFVDIVDILPKLNQFNLFKNEILRYFIENLQALNHIKQEVLQDTDHSATLDKEILKYSTLSILLDTNLEKFEDNYVINIKNKIDI